MSEKNSPNVSSLITSLLDALQRHTLFLITSSFAIFVSNFAKDGFKLGGYVIPDKAVFYVSVGLLFYGLWNLGRLSSKLKQLILPLTSINEEYKNILFSHHWILSPFNKMDFNKLRLVDCIPISIVFYVICALGKYIVRPFNSSSALQLWSQILPDIIRNILVWSACIALIFLYVLFLNNLREIIKKIYLSSKRYFIYTVGITLFMVFVEIFITLIIMV